MIRPSPSDSAIPTSIGSMSSLEPWGEVYLLEPNRKVRVDAVGPVGVPPNNMLEIEARDDGITVWRWGGSGVTVRDRKERKWNHERNRRFQQFVRRISPP